MPVAAVCSLLPAFFPGAHVLENASAPLFRAHFVVAMLAYSLFTLAALHAMLMSVAERRLHGAHLTRAFAALPPLLTMETLLFRLIGIIQGVKKRMLSGNASSAKAADAVAMLPALTKAAWREARLAGAEE